MKLASLLSFSALLTLAVAHPLPKPFIAPVDDSNGDVDVDEVVLDGELPTDLVFVDTTLTDDLVNADPTIGGTVVDVPVLGGNGEIPIDDEFFMQRNVKDKDQKGPEEPAKKHCYGSGTGVKKAQIMRHVPKCCASFQGRALEPFDEVSTAVLMEDEPEGTIMLCELRARTPITVSYKTCLAALSSFAKDSMCGKDKHENYKGGYAWMPNLGFDARVDPNDPNTGR